VRFIEETSKKPRDAKELLSEDPDIISLKDSLKVAAAKAVKRVAK